MYAGQVVETGPVHAVLKEPAHPYTELLLAAVPRRGKRLVGAQGTVPTLLQLPPGCFFYDRCPYRSDPRCATEAPPLREVGPGHWAAVHYEKSARRSSESRYTRREHDASTLGTAE